MNQRDLFEVLIKALGIYCIIRTVEWAGSFLTRLTYYQEFIKSPKAVLNLLVESSPFFLYICLVFLCLRFGRMFAKMLFPAEVMVFPEGASPNAEWLAFAFVLMGVFLILWRVPVDIFQCFWLITYTSGEATDPMFRRNPWAIYETGGRVIMNLCIGLCLIFGARGLANLVHKFRSVNEQSAPKGR